MPRQAPSSRRRATICTSPLARARCTSSSCRPKEAAGDGARVPCRARVCPPGSVSRRSHDRAGARRRLRDPAPAASGRADLPTAIAQARDDACRTSAIGRSRPKSPPACSAGGRPSTTDRRTSRGAARSARSRDRRDSPPQHLPAAAPHPRPGGGGRGRCGRAWRGGPASESAAGLVNAVLRACREAAQSLPLPARPDEADDRDRDGRPGLPEHHALAPALAGRRWLDRLGFETS